MLPPQSQEDTVSALLNTLTVPSRTLRAEELQSKAAAAPGGNLRMRNAAGGDLAAAVSGQARQLVISYLDGVITSAPVVEADVQSGAAVVHVLGPTPGQKPLASYGSSSSSGGRRTKVAPAVQYPSAMAALRDAKLGVGRFASLVEAAGLASTIGDEGFRSTLFAPSDKVSCGSWRNGVCLLWGFERCQATKTQASQSLTTCQRSSC